MAWELCDEVSAKRPDEVLVAVVNSEGTLALNSAKRLVTLPWVFVLLIDLDTTQLALREAYKTEKGARTTHGTMQIGAALQRLGVALPGEGSMLQYSVTKSEEKGRVMLVLTPMGERPKRTAGRPAPKPIVQPVSTVAPLDVSPPVETPQPVPENADVETRVSLCRDAVCDWVARHPGQPVAMEDRVYWKDRFRLTMAQVSTIVRDAQDDLREIVAAKRKAGA